MRTFCFVCFIININTHISLLLAYIIQIPEPRMIYCRGVPKTVTPPFALKAQKKLSLF